jgi:long-chain-fatty-acid--CoA ligase ACSBG
MEVKIFRVDPDDVNEKTECPNAKDLFQPTEEEKGEVCFRGRHIMMGYMANPRLGDEHMATINKKLAEAVDQEGWLHSGDQGTKDTRGMLRITGRYKELIIGAGGENIAPVPMEDRVKELCPAISNFLMIGDQMKYITALVTLKAKGATGELPGGDELDGAAAEAIAGVTTISGAAKSPEFIKMIEDAIVATNKDGRVCPLAPAKVQKFTILPYDFSVEGEELTPTLKTKRSIVQAKHKVAWEAMYDPANKANYVPHPTFA